MNNRNLDPKKKGFFGELVLQVRLVIRLMKDDRINPFLKLLPFAGFLYFIVPDLVIGPFDDTAIIFLGSYLFLEFCPPAIVQEHMRILRGEFPPPQERPDVIDAEFKDMDDDR